MSQVVSPSAARVVTFTPNPSIDRTVVLDGPLARGEVQRTASVTEQAAGKGVNVARVLRASGSDVQVVVAGLDHAFSSVFERQGGGLTVAGVELAADQHVRVNLTLTEPDGTTTKINEPGPVLSPAQVEQASALLAGTSRGARWVVLAGSVPPGAGADWYVRLIRAVRPLGCQVAVDTAGAALTAVMDTLPDSSFDLLKPNATELAQLVGGDPATFEADAARGETGAIVEAARALSARGIGDVLLTLGGSGAVLVNREGAWQCSAPPVAVRSTVGAGDSAVAGFILAAVAGRAPAECLTTAVRYGSAAAALPGTWLPTPQDLPRRPTVRRIG
ncbi:MAG: 1-phosphofructokinase family hexose kinase [Propioniciclava sp.]